MSKSGARTPLVGLFVAVIVILALYALTPAFYYIPSAALAAVIIHAVSDLIAGPSVWKRLWAVHPTEFLIFLTALIITLFTSVDLGIYVPVGLSLVIQLYRTARPNYSVLGKLVLHDGGDDAVNENTKEKALYYPITHPCFKDNLTEIAPGIIAFRPEENIIFQNAAWVFDKLTDQIKSKTRRGEPLPDSYGSRGWNEVGNANAEDQSSLSILRAVIFDMSGVHQMDSTGIDALIETARQAERYSGQACRWHFVGVESYTVRRALLVSGFGLQRRGTSTFFISDYVNMEDNGHKQSSPGCRNRNSTGPSKEKWEAEKGVSEAVTTVEDIETSASEEKLAHQSNGAGSSNTAYAVSSDDASEYCRCNQDGNLELGENIGHVRDKWPYFHQTIEEAVGAAVLGY